MVREVFPQVQSVARDEYEITDATLDQINNGLAQLVARGALICAMHPSRSALETQFREAVAGGASAEEP